MHQDEPAWIGSAYYFELLMRGEWIHPDWRLVPARENPIVGKLLFGIALRVTDCPVRSVQPLAAWYEAWHLKFEEAWWWTSLAAVTAWIPFPWPRYALPLLAPATLLVADTLVGLAIQIN